MLVSFGPSNAHALGRSIVRVDHARGRVHSSRQAWQYGGARGILGIRVDSACMWVSRDAKRASDDILVAHHGTQMGEAVWRPDRRQAGRQAVQVGLTARCCKMATRLAIASWDGWHGMDWPGLRSRLGQPPPPRRHTTPPSSSPSAAGVEGSGIVPPPSRRMCAVPGDSPAGWPEELSWQSLLRTFPTGAEA